MHTAFGGYYTEVTPVPIPNTEVKLCSAYDTWREAARESWSLPEQKEKNRYNSICSFFVEGIGNREEGIGSVKRHLMDVFFRLNQSFGLVKSPMAMKLLRNEICPVDEFS